MSKKKKNQIGKIFTITGLLLFAAALALSAYNLWDGYRAEQSREKLLEEYRDFTIEQMSRMTGYHQKLIELRMSS